MTDREKLNMIDHMIAYAEEFGTLSTVVPERGWGYYEGILVCISSVIEWEATTK